MRSFLAFSETCRSPGGAGQKRPHESHCALHQQWCDVWMFSPEDGWTERVQRRGFSLRAGGRSRKRRKIKQKSRAVWSSVRLAGSVQVNTPRPSAFADNGAHAVLIWLKKIQDMLSGASQKHWNYRLRIHTLKNQGRKCETNIFCVFLLRETLKAILF